MAKKKNPAAVALGKLRAKSMTHEEIQELGRSGGLVGGRKRAEALTPEKRRELAAKAARARWSKTKSKHKP